MNLMNANPRTSRWTWLTLAPVLTAAVMTLEARPRQTPPQTQTQRPTFTSQVDLVTLDVIVRDKRGQFVPDLKADDFVILEDGVPQAVSDHRLFYGGRELSVTILNAPTAAPEGMILPPTRPVADVAGRVFIIFIDDLHLQAGDSPRVRNLLTQITNTLVHDGDLFAVVSTVVNRSEPDVRPRPLDGINQESNGRRHVSRGDSAVTRVQWRTSGTAAPCARGFFDGIRSAQADGKDQQPPQGVCLSEFGL
jgi:hypothetical protein